MSQQSSASPASSNAYRNNDSLDDGGADNDDAFKPKHKIFLSHSGFQKPFVEELCVELERCNRFPFFDKRRESLPLGENFPQHIFDAIQHCHIGVVVLSEEFFTSKWPMMELVAMHDRVLDEAKKGKSFLKIIPIFFCTSLKEFDDPINHSRWLSCWHKLALKYPKRVKVENWKVAFKFLRSINGLVYDGLDEQRFQEEIVDEICKIVPPEVKLEDSHIQGKSRLCMVIREKIDALQKDKNFRVCIMGLYGMGGTGKTSICKVLCNEFFTEFRGRVCHAELERGSEEELLREVLKSLTNTSRERLDGFNVDQMRNSLKEGIIKDAVFLALDNMSDSDASINQVKSYLSGRLPSGSIVMVMVTARSKDWLTRVRPHIDEGKCMEMPELILEEAKSLFARSSDLELRNEVDSSEQLILRGVQRCYFKKDDGSDSRHYHPLALDVLGRQLARLTDLKEWADLLDRIDEDIFNQSRENSHPMFSILRKSFDTLTLEDQMLFMDVALFLPHYRFRNECSWSVFEWLGMVHKIPRVGDVKRALERLKTKSLLERVGDGKKAKIGMHDLWRAFCIAESKSGELGLRRWIYDEVICSELVESSPSGTCWENVKRMAFLDCEFRSLEKVNFTHFSNVTVLKMKDLRISNKVVVDISGLIHLKSLDVNGNDSYNLVFQGLPRNLHFLNFTSYFVASTSVLELIKQIECLNELQSLQLVDYGGDKLPDVRSMVSLRVAIFSGCFNVVTLTGLSSKLTNLRVLSLQGCIQLRSCPGVGDLVVLEELKCTSCRRLERLPNLRKLRKLRKLDISGCGLISELPGLGDLVVLEEFDAGIRVTGKAKPIAFKLPDVHKLRNLQVLDFGYRRLEAVPGFDSLISLRELVANFREVIDWPNLRQLTNLQKLRIYGWSSAGLRGLDNLVMLHTFHVEDCSDVDELPDFQSLISLQMLSMRSSAFKDVSSLSNLSTLESLQIEACMKLENIPDLQRLTRLKILEINDCAMLRGWDSSLRIRNSLRLGDTSVHFDVPDYQMPTGLQTLRLYDCINLADVMSMGAFSRLESLEIGSVSVKELPNLSNMPQLETLKVWKCDVLTRLTTREPLNALTLLVVDGCSCLTTLPDLCNFPKLLRLELMACDGVSTLSSSVPLLALQGLELEDCSGMKALPDLGMFPALQEFRLRRCSGILTLSTSGPSSALQRLELHGCSGLKVLPDLGMFAALRMLQIKVLGGLTALSTSVSLIALDVIELEDCSGVEALPDLGMFPALKNLHLQGCSALFKLSSSEPLTALTRIDASRCRSLSRDDLDQFRSLYCPQCQIYIEPLDDDAEWSCFYRLLGYLGCFRG